MGQIELEQAEPKMTFPTDAKFITFNYTSTLQSIYNIENNRVNHIHGSVDSKDELIFGHGRKLEEQSEFDEEGESTRTILSDAEGYATYPLRALQKPVESVLEQHENYFNQLDDIDEIIIIGHSLNSIDWPYFTKINNVVADVLWKVVCYEDRDRAFESLVHCGVPKDNISILEYGDIASIE